MASIPRAGHLSLRPSVLSRDNTLQISKRKTRNFSSSTHRSAATPRIDVARAVPRQPSITSRVKNMKNSDIPSDVGMVPGTFIRPTWKEGPSLFSSEWKKRLTMEWVFIRQTFSDFAGKVLQSRWGPKDKVLGKRIKHSLWLRERCYRAAKLHEALYHAIAGGDKVTIRQIACAGLQQQQLANIDRRILSKKPNQAWAARYEGYIPPEKLAWSIQALLPYKAIRVVADRQVQLPFGDKCTLRQVTLRVKTTQQLNKKDGSVPVTKEMTEYMVMQRIIRNNDVDDWKVWGTTKPSTYEDAMAILYPKTSDDGTKETVMDKFKMQMSDTMSKFSS